MCLYIWRPGMITNLLRSSVPTFFPVFLFPSGGDGVDVGEEGGG